MTIKDIDIESGMFVNPKDSSQMYLLYARGWFFATDSSVGTLIKTWTEANPDAEIFVVSTSNINDEKLKSINFCWIISQGDTLNNYLVRNGGCTGSCMLMDTDLAYHLEKEDPRTNFSLHIDKNYLAVYEEQVRSAEREARQNHRGIWRNGDSLYLNYQLYQPL